MLEILPIIGVVLLACAILGFCDYRNRQKKLAHQRENVPSSTTTPLQLCVDAYTGLLIDRTSDHYWPTDIPVDVLCVLEEKTLNRHHAIIHLCSRDTTEEAFDPKAFKTAVTSMIRNSLRGSWWRGLVVGIIIEASWKIEQKDMKEIVDGCGGKTIFLHWLVCSDPKGRETGAVHMPEEGLITPCLVSVLKYFKGEGHRVFLGIKEATGLYKWLKEFDDSLPVWMKYLPF